MKRAMLFCAMGILLIGLYGCATLLVGTAAGAGTAVWLGGKLTQEFDASYERTIDAAKKALQSLKLEIAKEIKEENVAQLRSKYIDGKDIWIDIRRITENSTKVEVRVGAVSPDKQAAAKILKRVQNYL